MVVGDDHKDGFAGVFSPDAKLVEPTCIADGYLAVWGDDIVADAPFFFRFVVGFGFGAGGVDLIECLSSEVSLGTIYLSTMSQLRCQPSPLLLCGG